MSTRCSATRRPDGRRRSTSRSTSASARDGPTRRTPAVRASRSTSSTRRRPSPSVCARSRSSSTPPRHGRRSNGDRAAGAAVRPPAAPPRWRSGRLPYGLRMPLGAYALAASRHLHEYGTTSEQLAQIAVDTRQWAARNPRARLRDPITIDDVLASPMEATPLHKLDCCLVTDGAGAVVMTSADRARTLRRPPVLVLGTGTCHTHSMISQMPDLTVTGAAVSGPLAFGAAGIQPSRRRRRRALRLVHHHRAVAARRTSASVRRARAARSSPTECSRPGGALPANTTGGGLCYTHPGQFGIFLLVEATRQLRGECDDRQVPDAEVAVAHGSGGVLSAMSTIVLGTEATA